MSGRLTPNVPKPNPELMALLERAKTLPPMTKEERRAQRRSWVVGEMMLAHPEMLREEAERLFDEHCDL